MSETELNALANPANQVMTPSIGAMTLPGQPAPVMPVGDDDPIHRELTALSHAIQTLANSHDDLLARISALESLAPYAMPAASEAYGKLHTLIQGLYDHLGMHKPV